MWQNITNHYDPLVVANRSRRIVCKECWRPSRLDELLHTRIDALACHNRQGTAMQRTLFAKRGAFRLAIMLIAATASIAFAPLADQLKAQQPTASAASANRTFRLADGTELPIEE